MGNGDLDAAGELEDLLVLGSEYVIESTEALATDPAIPRAREFFLAPPDQLQFLPKY